jgi:hypothetical protein
MERKKGYAIRRERYLIGLGFVVETLNRAAEWVTATNDGNHATLSDARMFFADLNTRDRAGVFIQGPCGGRHSLNRSPKL